MWMNHVANKFNAIQMVCAALLILLPRRMRKTGRTVLAYGCSPLDLCCRDGDLHTPGAQTHTRTHKPAQMPICAAHRKAYQH